MKCIAAFRKFMDVDVRAAAGDTSDLYPALTIDRERKRGGLHVGTDLEHVKVWTVHVDQRVVRETQRQRSVAAERQVVLLGTLVIIGWCEHVAGIAVLCRSGGCAVFERHDLVREREIAQWKRDDMSLAVTV